MKILVIGDIVARPGRTAVKDALPKLKQELKPDFVIANAENISHGRGASKETLEEVMNAGVDYFTSGDHIFWQDAILQEIETLPLIRPANYPEGTPGKGYDIVDLGSAGTILIINLMGRTFFNNPLDDPFRKIDQILEETQKHNPSVIIVDFHAEATSEKQAMSFYLDGRVDAVYGTHTHVPTCDQTVLPNGTLYISDIGMTGNMDSVLGVKKEIIQELFLTGRNQRFEWEHTGKRAFRSVIIDTLEKTIVRHDFNLG